jgi:hypothetical protein
MTCLPKLTTRPRTMLPYEEPFGVITSSTISYCAGKVDLESASHEPAPLVWPPERWALVTSEASIQQSAHAILQTCEVSARKK